ncbi:MAG: zinc-ribbon domain-containing protein [Oscillospiraceae bacterium]|nr:zinc-ribbon domain-containing protein [Oscillospiraceae bacterium]
MFCAFCGKQISDTAKFCPACGKATGVGAPVSAPAPAPVSAPVPQPAPAPAPIPVPAPAPQGGPCCHVCRTPIPCGDTCPNCGAKLPVPGPGTTWADVMEAERHAKAKKKKAWLVVGCVLGGLVALTLIALLLLRFLGIGGMLGSAEDTPAEEASAEEAALTYNEGMNGGGDAYDSGDYETALEYYLAALDAAEGGEEELNARSCLARTYLALEEYESCMEMCHAVLETDAELVEMYAYLAQCYYETGDPYLALDTVYLGMNVDDTYGPLVEFSIRLEEELGIAAPEETPEEIVDVGIPDLITVTVMVGDPMAELCIELAYQLGYELGVDTGVASLDDPFVAMDMMLAGESDALMASVTQATCEEMGYGDFVYTLPYCEWAGEEYCVVLPATHADLRDAFSEIIILLSEAGVMQEMLDAMLPGAVALY